MDPFIAQVIPFGGFTGGVYVAAADVNNDTAASGHENWIIIDSMSSPISR